jgi:hypothetical protein
VLDLGSGHEFFAYQHKVNDNDSYVPSHQVIEESIQKNGLDYRFQNLEHPALELRDCKTTNKEVGRRSLSLV